MKEIRIYLLLTILFSLPVIGLAQDKWEKPAGGIENAQVIIEKDKVISLRPVSRRFQAIQVDVPKVQPLAISYQFRDIVDSLPSLQVIVRPKTMTDQPLEKFYGFNAKLGYGNYNSPYALIDLSNKRSDEYMLNLHLNHYSSGKGPVADKFSGAGLTRVGAAGKYFLNNIALSSSLDYNYQTYSMYGYDLAEIEMPGFDQDKQKQKLNQFGFTVGIADNNLKNSIDQGFVAGINTLANNHQTREFLLDLNYNLNWRLQEDWLLKLVADFSLANQNGLNDQTINRQLVELSPDLGYKLDQFTFTVGVNSFYQNDPIDSGSNKIYVFPKAEVSYAISDKHSVNFGISGDIEQNTLQSLYQSNLYLDSLIHANNNVNNFSAGIGIQGKFSDRLGYGLRYDFLKYDRINFFNNSFADTARFELIYDLGGASLSRFMGNLSFILNDKVNFKVAGLYNAYNTKDITAALHKPRLALDFTANVQLFDKLNASFTYSMLEGLKALQQDQSLVNLATINDLNLGLDLAITERAGVFVDLRNILGNNYQIYNNYPVKGFQVIAGIGIKF